MLPIRRSSGSGAVARPSLSKRGAFSLAVGLFWNAWTAAVTHLLLGDERGALAVRGVVGEVVREGFDPVPRGLAQDPVGDLK